METLESSSNMKSLIILSAILGVTLTVNGFTTPDYFTGSGGPNQANWQNPCWRAHNDETNRNIVTTCIRGLIQSREFRSSLDLDVCEFAKKTEAQFHKCLIEELVKLTDCPRKQVESMMGTNESGESVMSQQVNYIFCNGPNPFGRPENAA